MGEEARRRRVLRQHLQTEKLLGVEEVPVGSRAPSLPPATQSPAVLPPVGKATAATAPLAAPASSGGMDRAMKLKVLEAMDAEEVRGCTRCELSRCRTRTVFGEGDPAAALMFIGEGPGQTEDEQGRPFVGRAGELLDKMIVAMGLRREDVYIANVVKCRPPQNRAPLPPEVDACWDYLRRQIETIRPRAIVTLGGPATKLILKTDRGITSIRGMWGQFDGLGLGVEPIPVMPTFHPAYLLRAYTPDNRKKVWSDLKNVMAKIEAGGK